MRLRLCIIAICIALLPIQASAATFYLAASGQTLAPNGEHTIGVYIAADAPINTIAGSFSAPEGWHIEAVLTAGSIVDVWVEQPVIADEQVRFAGIIPGGFSGNAGHIFSVRVTPNTQGEAEITIEDAEAYLHDGFGTIDQVTVVPLMVQIEDRGVSPERAIALLDSVPPELFTPVIVSDPLLYNGDKVALFGTQDMQSGIVRYEVQESGSKIADEQAWMQAVSPYHVVHQTGKTWLHVRAVDAAGNTTEASVALASSDAWFGYKVTFAILILFASALLVRVWRKKGGTSDSRRSQ